MSQGSTINSEMTWKVFLLEAYKIYRGTLVSKVTVAILTLGTAMLLGASSLGILSAGIGLSLILVAVGLTIFEMHKLYRLEVLKLENHLIPKEIREVQSDDAFFRLRAESEKSALSILRRLIDMHFGIHETDPTLAPVGKKVRYGDENAVFRYIDAIVVGQVSTQAKIDFFSLLGDTTGHPLAYKFVLVYEGLKKEAALRSKMHLLYGTPLYQAFSNITDPMMQPIREQSFWEAYV